jgi:hypothetical protein
VYPVVFGQIGLVHEEAGWFTVSDVHYPIKSRYIEGTFRERGILIDGWESVFPIEEFFRSLSAAERQYVEIKKASRRG